MQSFRSSRSKSRFSSNVRDVSQTFSSYPGWNHGWAAVRRPRRPLAARTRSLGLYVGSFSWPCRNLLHVEIQHGVDVETSRVTDVPHRERMREVREDVLEVLLVPRPVAERSVRLQYAIL